MEYSMSHAERFTTYEVGSLAKPEWRVRGVGTKPMEQTHVKEAEKWAGILHLDADPLLALLEQSLKNHKPISADEHQEIHLWASRFGLRLEEQAGLDIVYDGEQNRIEMYEHAVKRSKGFEPREKVRAFDDKFYRKFASVGVPQIETLWHTLELMTLQKMTKKPLKVPITGAYTLAAWSFDEYYNSRNTLTHAIAKNLLRPNIADLIAHGAKWIQIDEPAATTNIHEIPLFIDSFNESVKGFEKTCVFSIHNCFSDYAKFFAHIDRLQNCSQLSLEFANRDHHRLGTQPGGRPAYDVLKKLKGKHMGIGLGVVDIHSDTIESPELVRDRILYAANILGPEYIFPSPDCGLRTRTWNVAYAKLQAVVEGSRMAEHLLFSTR